MTRRAELEQQARQAIYAQERAEEKKERGELRWLADDPDCPNFMRLAALGEEFGEACMALHDGEPEQLAVELTQLAGVALAWGVALAREMAE